MAGAVAQPLYRAWRGKGESRRRAGGLAIALAGCLLGGGCSISLPIASLKSDDPVTTSSTTPRAVSPLSPALSMEDWRRAQGALAIALDPSGNGSAVSWDNPETTLKGSFAPVGGPFVRGDEVCRAFLSSLTGQEGEVTWLQGTACRLSGKEWAVKEVKPWRKPA